MRRSGSELEEELLSAFDGALGEVGVAHELVERATIGPRSPDAVFDVAGSRVVIEVKSIVSATQAVAVVNQLRHAGAPALVAALRIADTAKEVFRQADVGYFDARGALRLVLPGVFIDASVTPVDGRRGPGRGPLDGDTAKEVALLLLGDPTAAPGVREIARLIERSPSSVSVVLDRLRDAGLATSHNEPLVPDLFWALSDVWRRQAIPLAGLPSPGNSAQATQLQLGLGERLPDGQWRLDPIGWALGDTLAAVAWGAPLAVDGSYPPDFYVPSAAVLRSATRQFGRPEPGVERACTVSVAPVRYVCASRVTRPAESWPITTHVITALDLAIDQARGREVLENWRPADVARVW